MPEQALLDFEGFDAVTEEKPNEQLPEKDKAEATAVAEPTETEPVGEVQALVEETDKGETVDEPRKKAKTRQRKATKEAVLENSEGEPQEESATEVSDEGESDESDEPTAESSKKKQLTNLSIPEEDIRPDGWHKNTIGEPSKRLRPNPYFQGVIAHDGFDGGAIHIPFKEINWASRQIYVDDIHLQNPTMIEKPIYRISGSFREVVARITEEQFNAVLKHPEIKLQNVTYSYVSDDARPRRAYSFKHNNWPTQEEIAKQDASHDETEIALGIRQPKDKKKQAKEEILPDPVDEFAKENETELPEEPIEDEAELQLE